MGMAISKVMMKNLESESVLGGCRLERVFRKPSRLGFPRAANAGCLFPGDSGGRNGQAVQYGFARAGGCGDRGWDVDAPSGSAVCDRHRDSRDLGAAKASNGRCPPRQTRQAEGFRADA